MLGFDKCVTTADWAERWEECMARAAVYADEGWEHAAKAEIYEAQVAAWYEAAATAPAGQKGSTR